MPPASQGGQGQQDNSMGFLWILVAVFAALFATWYFAHDYLIHYLLLFKYYELMPLQWVSSKAAPIMAWIANTPTPSVTFDQLTVVLTLVGKIFSVPLAIILFILAFILYRANPTRSFRRAYSMETLAKAEVVNWPMIGPVTKMNLIKQDLSVGAWAMCSTPLEFGKKHGLLQLVEVPLAEGKLQRERKYKLDVSEAEANKIFTMQMGRPFTTLEAMPIYSRALFAIFAARANRDRASADQLLTQIAISSKTGKLDFTGVDLLLKKHSETKPIKAIMTYHAYLLPFMASMLQLARTDGVLASAEFLWLKPVDRRLWFMLNNVGRQTAFTEVAGPFAHWLAEKELRRKIVSPMIQEATKAFTLAISEVEYNSELHGELNNAGAPT